MERTSHEYYITHEGEEFPLEFNVIDDSEMVYVEGDRAVVGYLVLDDDAESPRSDDNLGKMVCWHSRYNLGDEQPTNISPAEYLKGLASEFNEKLDEKLEALYTRLVKKLGSDNAALDAYPEAEREMVEAILNKNLVMLPLYLYDHSGLAMSTGSFHDPWDSGQVGWIYCTLSNAIKEWSLPEKATWKTKVDGWDDKGKTGKKITLYQAVERILTSEVKTYDEYLRGNIYGVCFATFNKVDDEWEPDETAECWGYIGTDHAKGQMKDDFEDYWKPKILEPKEDHHETQ